MINLDFKDVNALVVGDIMLDIYYYGGVNRISPEAPVPVVNIKNTANTPGGAANVANNITSLKGNCFLVGYIGNDGNGEIIQKLVQEINIKDHFIHTTHPTITKVRIIGDHQQIVRMDFEKKINYEENSSLFSDFCTEIESILNNNRIDVIILSDYNKGLASKKICNFLIQKAKLNKIKIIIDPKDKNWEKYKGATTITPNFKEFSEIIGDNPENNDKTVEEKARPLVSKYALENVLITRSKKGMSLITGEESIHIHSEAKEVFDVSGAGDTVVAVLGLCFGKKYKLFDSIKLANIAAGIVVGKMGTTPISMEELRQPIRTIKNIKYKTVEELKEIIKSRKQKKQMIVFTNGCFDIIHRGHISYLKEAKYLGDILIIGVNSDDSVKRLKGSNRPINNEMDRIEVLSAFEFVDYVVKFGEDTPFNLIKSIKPDILVKGGDYKEEEVVGHEFAGKVQIINYIEGYSTTTILNSLNGDAK